MINPNIKISKSKGVDLPILYVYLAGRIAGDCIDKCIAWRKEIREHYQNYKPVYELRPLKSSTALNPEFTSVIVDYESYPISFLDPLNSGESKSVDSKGLTSSIPPNLIFDKDLLSVEKADVIVANMDDYMEEEIDFLSYPHYDVRDINLENFTKQQLFNRIIELEDKIKNRRENLGTICEVSWALYLRKPLILIVPENRKEIFEKHPFMKRASVIVTSSKQLIKEKWLNLLYKSISGAIYE